MPTASSSARKVAAAFALAAAGAGAAWAPLRAGAAPGDGRPAPTSSTCRVCHVDPAYGPSYSHASLEGSGDGCLACHPDGGTHAKGRGGKGNIPVPSRQEPAVERTLCVACHEEETYAAPVHLAPKPAATRCTDCHRVHGALPVRAGKAPQAGPPAPAAPAEPAPGPGAFVRGTAEAGWRFVGGEEGRYAQDVGLDDGPRLFALRAEFGADGTDPLAAKGEASLEGLGDPHALARVRARKGDAWKVALDARRDEHPFLAQEGLHGGEVLRERFDGSVEIRLDPTWRAAGGYSFARHEGDLGGSVLEGGVVLPVAVEQDRATHETWGQVRGAGRGWHLSLRQAWLAEAGEDGKSREESEPGAPDSLRFEDDSNLSGPLTAAVAGFEAMDGRLAVEARASRADLEREVDVVEERRFVAGAPAGETTEVEGSRVRRLDVQSLDASLDLGAGWSVEAGAERRALREDGDLDRTTTTLDSTGVNVKRTSVVDRVSQRVDGERVGVRRSRGGFTVRAGAERLADALEASGGAGATVRTKGIYAGADGGIGGGISVLAEGRSARSSGIFTPLTPEHRDEYRLGASWKGTEGRRIGVDWRRADLSASRSDLASRGDDFRVRAGNGLPDGISWDAGYGLRRTTLSVDTLSYAGTSLVPGKSLAEVRATLADLVVTAILGPRLRLECGGAWTRDRGNLPVTAWDATAGFRWDLGGNVAARIRYRHRTYDEQGADALDYAADSIEVSLEMGF
jgi:hypothetical protein